MEIYIGWSLTYFEEYIIKLLRLVLLPCYRMIKVALFPRDQGLLQRDLSLVNFGFRWHFSI